MELTIINATTKRGISQSSHSGQPTGIYFVDGSHCQYGGISADSFLKVDFDVTNVGDSGLYLVEVVTADGVAWRGCRRFRRGVTGLRVDDTGAGNWCEVAGSDLRVVGRVLKVYVAE